MKRAGRGLFFFVFILLITGSCKRYDEDPMVTFRTPMSRITGEWVMTSYLINNESEGFHWKVPRSFSCKTGSNVLYEDQYIYSEWKWYFEKNGDFSSLKTSDNIVLDFEPSFEQCTPIYKEFKNVVFRESGVWEFVRNKNSVKLKFLSVGEEAFEMRIREMKNTQMTWERTINGDKILWALKKIK